MPRQTRVLADGFYFVEAPRWRDGRLWFGAVFANTVKPVSRAAECVRVAEGGAVLEVVDTAINCYACALDGDDRRTLFMLVAPPLDDPDPAPRGRIPVATVDTGPAERA